MKAHFVMTNPDAAEFSMTLIMSLGKWRKLREQLADVHPSWELASKIHHMIIDAEQAFCARSDDE